MTAGPKCGYCGREMLSGRVEKKFYSKWTIYVCPDKDCKAPPVRRFEQRKARRRSLIVAILLAVLASIDLTRLLQYTGFGLPSNVSRIVFAAAFLASIYFAYKYYSRRNSANFRNGHAPPPETPQLRQPDYAAIAREAAAASGSIRRSQVFIAGVVAPRSLRNRVTDAYTIGQRVLKQRITIEARIPDYLLRSTEDGGHEPVHFPVLLPEKGRLHDSFSVRAADGSLLTVLTYHEYLVTAARSVGLLLRNAGGRPADTDLSEVEEAVFGDAVRLIAARMERGSVVGEAPRVADEIVGDIPPPDARLGRTAVNALRALLATLDRNFAIVVVVTPDSTGRIVLTVEQDLVPDLKLDWKARLAITLGARPVHLSLDLVQASTCDSFHMIVTGSEDLYLGDQDLEEHEETLAQPSGSVPPFYYRFRSRLGQPYAHFYARFFPPSKGRNSPRIRLKFFERPPGSTLPAAASAFVAFIIIWVVAVLTKVDPDPSSDAPAWLLAFPALAAAWLGIEAPTGRLLGGTLAARVSLAVTIGSCIAASTLFMAHNVYQPDDGFRWWTLPGDWSIFWIGDVSWLIVFFIAMFNAATIIYSYLTRTAYYEYLSSRRGQSDVQQYA